MEIELGQISQKPKPSKKNEYLPKENSLELIEKWKNPVLIKFAMECNRILDFEYKFTMVINLTFPNPNLFSKNKILSASTAGTPSNDLIITNNKIQENIIDNQSISDNRNLPYKILNIINKYIPTKIFFLVIAYFLTQCIFREYTFNFPQWRYFHRFINTQV